MAEDAPPPTGWRLAFVSHEFPPTGGGAASALDAMSRVLSERGHRVTIVTTGPGRRDVTDVLANDRTVIRLGAGRRSMLAPPRWDLIRAFTALRGRGAAQIADVGPDVIVAYLAFPAGLATMRSARSLGVPLVVSLRGSDVPGFAGSPFRGPLRVLPRTVCRRADLVLANGPRLAALASAMDPTLDVVNLPNGVDTARFQPPERSDTRGPTRFVAVGQLIDRKQPLLLLEGFLHAVYNGLDATLTIVGDGPLRETLLTKIRGEPQARNRVELRGVADREHELPELYRQHDVLVHLSKDEGVSNTLLEGLASGLGVVASPEVLHGLGRNDIGIAVAAPSVVEVARALTAASARASEKAWRRTHRAVAASRSWEHVTDEFEALLESRLGLVRR